MDVAPAEVGMLESLMTQEVVDTLTKSAQTTEACALLCLERNKRH